ncbi:MAG: PEP-CTERM sorting domain-containing protein [Planctomycetes bacterium]|nr:PEP-CTERM sorting domain-containing protein [Planctomycetota bacterium]
MQDFDNPGSPYTLGQFGSPPPAGVEAGGWSGSFMRLVRDGIGSQLNTIAFDLTEPGPQPAIVANFDFRMGYQPSLPRNLLADGLAVAFLNTANFSPSGPALLMEEAAAPGSIGVGFDIWDNGEVSNNHVSVHYDGATLTTVDLWGAGLDLANGEVRSVYIEVAFGPGGALLDLDITPAETGVPLTVLDDFLIAGVLPYESRVAFGARTGGLYAHHDLDNIVVYAGAAQVIPEPGSLALLALSLLALASRRRHRSTGPRS